LKDDGTLSSVEPTGYNTSFLYHDKLPILTSPSLTSPPSKVAMFKNVLIAAAIVFANPALLFAEDIFFAFGQGASASSTATTTSNVGTGSVFIFSDGEFAFDAADLDFTNSDFSVIQFTGGVGFNPIFNTIGDVRFNNDAMDPILEVNSATDGVFQPVNVTENGINPTLGQLFDPLFDPAVGPDGAFLLARVDFDIVGEGTADIVFTFGPNGVINLDNPDDIIFPSLGSATLTVISPDAIPEPSSAALMILGTVGLIVRRKRT